MLKMSRVYILAEVLSKILGKGEGKLGTLFAIMILQINDLVPTYFFFQIYYAITACMTTTFTFGKC